MTRLGPNHAVGVARAVTIGAAVGAAVSTTAQVYSACLDSLTLVAATAVLTTTFRPRPGAGWPGAPLLGAGAILAGAYLLPLVGWLTGPTALPWLAGAGLALAARALSAPPRGAPVNLAGPTAIIAVAVAVLTGASSPLPAVVVACVGQLFGWAMGRRAESISDGAPDVWTVGGTWRAVPAGVPVLAPLACGAWASTRNWDSGFVAALLAVGFGLGAATTGRKPTAGMGVLALLLLAGAASGLGPVPIAFAGVALLAGLLARVLGGSPPRVAAGALLFTGLLPLLAPLVPDARTRELAQVVAAPPAVTARLEAARGRAAPVAQGLGARGAWALSRDGDHLLLEADGVAFEAEGRVARAERFAGTLAGCMAASTDRAVVAGDVLGAATEGALAQHFQRVDSAVPDPSLLQAALTLRPARRAALLAPSARLVPLPDLAVLHATASADAFVEVIRAPWTRPDLLRPENLARLAAKLRPGGVVVLALGADRAPAEVLGGWIRTFAAFFPTSALWLPPEGAEVALLTGTRQPASWTRIEACVAADAAALATVHVRDAVDLGALALADSESLASLLPAPREGLGPPAWLTTDPGVPLADLGPMQARPERIFQGAPGALTDRAAGRAALLDVLRAADKGDLTGAVNRARALDQLPGGDQSLAPLLAPHLERARIAQAQGRKDGLTSPAWQQAESALATAAAIAPENASVRCLEGDLAMDQGQLVRAQTAFEACARLDPDSLEAQTGLARARGALGNTAGAELALRTAAAAHPEVWTAAHNLGVWLLDAGRYDEAEPLLKQAAANQAKKGGPLSSAPYLALARLYLATARPQLALAQAQRAVTTEESATGLALRGAARYELGTMDAAESDFRAALAKNPDEVLALGGLGQIHATRGEYDLAAKQFTAVLQRDPRNAAARANLERLGPMLQDPQAPKLDGQ